MKHTKLSPSYNQIPLDTQLSRCANSRFAAPKRWSSSNDHAHIARLINLVRYTADPDSGQSASSIQGDVSQGQVVVWKQHPALLPLGLVKHIISTEVGDVELHLSYAAARDRALLLWAFTEVRQLHPKATDLDVFDTLSLTDQFLLTLHLVLEYVQLAQDGRGHNDRSRYLARSPRQIASHAASQPVCPSVTPTVE